MGSVKLELSKCNLPERELHNSRMFIDLAENIHIHHREFRTVFSLNEFFEYTDILEKSKISVLEYLENNVNYQESKYPTTLFIAGGKNRQLKFLENSPRPNKSFYFNDLLSVELQDEFVTDEIHIHYRDLRIVMNRKTFKIFSRTIEDCRKRLELFEKDNNYTQKNHVAREINEEINDKIKINYNNINVVNIDLDQIHSYHYENIFKLSAAIVKNNPKEVDNKTIKKLVKSKNSNFIPIILSTEKNGEHFIIDGHHRYIAAKKLNKNKIEAIILDLTFKDSENLRKADSLLKEFDYKTNYKYGISDYWALYLSFKTNKFYYRDFDKKMLKTSLIYNILRYIKNIILRK